MMSQSFRWHLPSAEQLHTLRRFFLSAAALLLAQALCVQADLQMTDEDINCLALTAQVIMTHCKT